MDVLNFLVLGYLSIHLDSTSTLYKCQEKNLKKLEKNRKYWNTNNLYCLRQNKNLQYPLSIGFHYRSLFSINLYSTNCYNFTILQIIFPYIFNVLSMSVHTKLDSIVAPLFYISSVDKSSRFYFLDSES